jgi:predicted TIM-barrel fold metal-dependent hydrolase
MPAFDEEDPGLPIKLGPASNGEFAPEPLSPVLAAVVREARAQCEDTARRIGMDRRQFLKTSMAAAITLFFLDRLTAVAAAAEPGGEYRIPIDAMWEPLAAEERLGGDEFIFDVQGHLLQYDLDPATRGRRFWGDQFPQVNCGEDDPRACFSMTHFMEEMFLRSDTSMVALSGLPIHPEGSPLPLEVMDETRRVALGLARDDRVLLHAQALPHVAHPKAGLQAMEDVVADHDVAGWKTFTHFRDPDSGARYFLDDHDLRAPQVGRPFIEKSLELGVNVICVHKGLSGRSGWASPVDIGPVAADYPEMSFIVYHCGFETSITEGPYTETTKHLGINRLIGSLLDNGIGPGGNVYGELGSIWWYLMRTPTEAAHVLGKLLRFLGEDNILWGTDSIWYGSPQDQIQAMRAFSISARFRETYGYPPLGGRAKRKIFGLNAARLYGVEPTTVPFDFTREELAEIRRTFPDGNHTWGPTTMQEFRRVERLHYGWP